MAGASFSGNKPHNGAFIVYINGIEVPCKSVSDRIGVWQIPEFQLEMVADPVLTRFGAEDRVQVVVFYLDDVTVDPSQSPAFKVFAEGEITGWGYRRVTNGRSIILTCVNQMAIFTQLFVQFLTNLDDMIAHATFAGSGTFEFSSPTSQIVYPFSLFKQGLILPQGSSAPDITRPFDFLYNILRGMVGANVPAGQQSIPASNFFARWARLTNFVNRFVASPVFDEGVGDANIFPILKALQTTSAVDVLTKNLLSQIQNTGSMYDMLQLIYQTVFMEMGMLPRMPLVSVDLKTSTIQQTDFTSHKVSNASTTQPKPGQPAAAPSTKVTSTVAPNPTKPNRLMNYFAKPQFLFGLPPACNVIFPSMIELYEYNENFATQPTRLYFNDEVIPSVLKVAQNGFGQSIQNALTLAYPPAADAANLARQSNPKTNGKNFLLFPEEFFKGPVMDRRKVPTWLFFLKQAEMTQLAKNQGSDSVANPTEPPVAQQDLFEQLKNTSPDVYHLYTEYEYFRERYSRRTGSVVSVFDPYVVAGFPCLIFDDRASRVDIFAYVTTVSSTMYNSKQGRQTTISYAYGRTVQEMFDILAAEFADGQPAAGVAPPEPISDIRRVIQDFDQAESFYEAMFFGRQKLFGQDAVADWRKLVGYPSIIPGQPPTAIFINGASEATLGSVADAGQALVALTPQLEALKLSLARTQVAIDSNNAIVNQFSVSTGTVDLNALQQAQVGLTAAQTTYAQLQTRITALETQIATAQNTVNQNQATLAQTQVQHNLDATKELVPLPAAQKMFDNYDAAIRYKWRPICTLDEYIIFHDSAGEGVVPAFNHPRSVGAQYYDRIRRFTPLTADFRVPTGADGLTTNTAPNPNAATPTTVDPLGDSATPASQIASAPGITSGTGPNGTNAANDFPQTRSDWDSALLAYRNNAYNVKVPRT